MESHARNGTWKLIPRSEVPPDYAILRDRWADSDKTSPSGDQVRFKARLTAMGCFQQPIVFQASTIPRPTPRSWLRGLSG